jgi:glycolate oxidase FAD binding subunit
MAADSIPEQLIAACRSVRLAGPADAVAGVQPSFVAAPASTDEASGVLRAAAALQLTVVPRGTGSRLQWGSPPERCDLVIEMTQMDQVLEHAAGDLVAKVQAGCSLERLAEVLGAAGQRLALDPPAGPLPSGARPALSADPALSAEPALSGAGPVLSGAAPAGAGPAVGASTDAEPGPPATRGTIGGVLATGAAGPLRFRYGTPRDLLIGITFVRADGTVARSGGKVVKNVAGYDLGKLFAGSRGTLGLITEATFRLHPAPAATAYVGAVCAAPADAGRLLAAALDSPLAPVAAELHWPAAVAPIRIGIALEGDAAAVAERAEAMADLLAQVTGAATPTTAGRSIRNDRPVWWGAGPAAQPDGTVLQIAFWPGDLGLVLAEIRAAASSAGLDPAVGGSAAAGMLHAAVPADADPAAVAALIDGLRAALGQARPASAVPQPAGNGRPSVTTSRQPGGSGRQPSASGRQPSADGHSASHDRQPPRASAVVLHAPPAVRALVDLFGPVQSLGLMRAVKAQFDPDRRMAPGRFAGGI